MAKKKPEKRVREPDPVRIQIGVKIKTPVVNSKKRLPPKEVVESAIEQWIETGDSNAIRNIQIVGVSWENYGRDKPPKTARDPEDIEEARTTLRLSSILRKRGIGFFRLSRTRTR